MLFRKKDRKDGASAANGTSDSTTTAEAVPAPVIIDDGVIGLPGEDEAKPAQLAQTTTTATLDIVYPKGAKLVLLLLSVFVSMFLVSLVSCLPLSIIHTLSVAR